MISKVTGVNFKGRTFGHEIGPKTLIVGPKGSGKSSTTQAIQLVISGYVPSEKPKKLPRDIFAAFSSGKRKFSVGVQSGKSRYKREYTLAPSGSVSQKHMIGTGKHSKDDFNKAIGGLPQPFDLSVFMTQSDQKKIDTLFELFPPADNVARLQAQVDAAKDKKQSAEKDIESLKKTIGRLSKSKTDIDLPSGTLAEVQQEIKRTEAEWTLTSKNIATAEAEEALTKKQDEEAKSQKQEPEPTPDTNTTTSTERPVKTQTVASVSIGGGAVTKRVFKVRDSIQSIIDSMERTGCDACAARLIAKRELNKLKEVLNGREAA